MARKVFFSFHYQRDVLRVTQVRNSWVIRSKGEATPFYDKAEFEQVKRNHGGIERWIEQQMKGTSVIVVLFGAETHTRPWVRHEIKRSVELGKGLIAVDIHNVRAPNIGIDVQGRNPLDFVTKDGFKLSQLYKTYDWVWDNGYENMASWIENAARDAGR